MGQESKLVININYFIRFWGVRHDVPEVTGRVVTTPEGSS